MDLTRYRRVLSAPGVRSVLLTGLVARMPIVSAPIVATLHVVLDLDRGFASSGAVAASFALGSAIGSPQLGRLMDRVGLRPVLGVTTAGSALFWLSVAWLPYAALVPAAFIGGLLPIPIYTITRQSLAALLPEHDRQAAFSLDSMAVELSYATAPAMAIVLATQSSPRVALVVLGVLIVGSGLALLVINPPIHGLRAAAPGDDGRGGRTRPPAHRTEHGTVRSSVTPDVAGVLLLSAAATFTVMGTDVSVTAVMRSFEQVPLIGAVFGVWCLASLVGGFVYGAGGRVDPTVLLALLAALCVPVALASNWWLLLLAVIPTGLLCAPLLVATADQVIRVTPEAARGQALGLNSAALTVGNALGAPCVGLVVDHTHPRLGFVAIGLAGLALAGAAAVIHRRRLPSPSGAVALVRR